MKISIATIGDSSSPQLWSGVPLALRNEFNKYNGKHQVSFINWKINKWILRIYYIILGRFLYLRGTSREFILRPFYQKKLNSEINKNQPDVILFIGDFFAMLNDKNIKKAMYGDANIVEYLRFCNDDKRLFKNVYLNHFDKVTNIHINKLDYVFTQNEWTRQGFINYYNLNPNKVINVHFGVNLKIYNGNKNYDNNLLLIVLRKGTEEYKGLNLLLSAFKILKEQLPSVKLAIVGTDNGIKMDGITYYYGLSREVTIELFKESTLYVMPALREPNGITYLEALANKTPIVGLNRFAFPEFSGYGEWGFICKNEDPKELADIIFNALMDKDKLKQMGLKGQKFVEENYKWDIVVKKMISYLEK